MRFLEEGIIIIFGGFWIIIVAVVAIMAARSKLPKSTVKFIIIAILFFVVSYQVTKYALQPDLSATKTICKQSAKLSTPESLQLKGYLLPYRHLYKDPPIESLLIEKGFQFIEQPASNYDIFIGLNGGSDGYFRYFLTDEADASCASFNKFIGRNGHALQRLREIGLPAGTCIASVRTSDTLSEYEIVRVSEPHSGNPSFDWDIHRIQNLHTGKIFAEYRSFTYSYKYSFISDSFVCFDPAQLDYLLKNSIKPLLSTP